MAIKSNAASRKMRYPRKWFKIKMLWRKMMMTLRRKKIRNRNRNNRTIMMTMKKMKVLPLLQNQREVICQNCYME